MLDILVFMAPAICICFVLTGICVYIGIHVIMREVIFIDIALAQIAALGASTCLFFNLELNSLPTFLISLGFTLVAAILLSWSKKLTAYVPQEAFIGIMYATGAATLILMGDRLAHGAEHAKELMVGHLLWTNWREVAFYFVFYLVLGIVYALLHKKLFAISQTKKNNSKAVKGVFWWEFVFYALLGLVVTVGVQVAGVLMMFGFLVVPAVIGALLGSGFKSRLLIGWTTGLVFSLLGSYLSYSLDFPTGATIVVSLGAGLLVIAIIKGFLLYLQRAR